MKDDWQSRFDERFPIFLHWEKGLGKAIKAFIAKEIKRERYKAVEEAAEYLMKGLKEK